MSCPHMNFKAEVTVNRVEDTGQFMADIQICCVDCNLPFHFIGVDYGVSFNRPMISILGTELRIPIGPGNIPIPKIGSFKVEM